MATAAAAAAAAGGFDVEAQELRDEIIQVQLQECHGEPLAPVIYDQVEDRLRNPMNLMGPCHVFIGPRQWNRPLEEGVLYRVHEKHMYLKYLLRKGGNDINNNLLLNLIKGVNEKLGIYEGLQRKELVKRMLLDGCYIVYKFAKCDPPSPRPQGSYRGLLHMMGCFTCCWPAANSSGSSSNSDPEAGGEMQPLVSASAQESRTRTTNSVRSLEFRDTWCLVNSCVPYDVVDVINKLVLNAPEGGFGLETARILLQHWSMYLPRPSPNQESYIVSRDMVNQAGDANCLLFLLAQLLKPCHQQGHRQEEGEELLCRWLPATEYVSRCNVRFVASPLDANKQRCSVLDVTITFPGYFRTIDVQIPPLRIDGTSLALLRNLVQLERLGITGPPHYVMAYCLFMHRIARQREDVKLLHEAGIIHHGFPDHIHVVDALSELASVCDLGDATNTQGYLMFMEQELERRRNSTVHLGLSKFHLVINWIKANFLPLITLLFGVPSLVYTVLTYNHGQAAAPVPP